MCAIAVVWPFLCPIFSRKEDSDLQKGQSHATEIQENTTQVAVVDFLPEILVEIFSLCRPPFPTSAISTAPAGFYNWIRSISYVCHRWREVAISSPNPWNEIASGYNDITSLFMQCSRHALLYVSVKTLNNKFLELILDNISRIWALDIGVPDTVALSMLKHPSPAMQHPISTL